MLFILVIASTIAQLQAVYIAELTDDNFYEYVKDKDVILVDFYAPWCSDCKNLDPEMNKAADTLERRSGDLAKVDCFGTGRGLCEMYRVKSWPQLKLFRKGNYIGDYTGAQTGDAIALYVESLATQSYETQSVPSNVVAAGQQLPYQPMTQQGAAVPGASPQAAVPAPQPQMQSSQKVSTLENSNAKVEAHAKATIHKEKGTKKNLTSKESKKLKKIAKAAKSLANKLKKNVKKLKKPSQ